MPSVTCGPPREKSAVTGPAPTMTYQEILTHIYGLARFGMKPGLDRIRSILSALSNPQNVPRVIHVAGTNGKGSTAAFLSSILTAAGHRAGLFTSPHLTAFTERIRVNGAEISREEVISLAQRVLSAAPPDATFFEIATAMSYLHFAEREVDAAIMEVGMGGRLDATNAVEGVLSLISPISLDHCQHLGNSIASIASEKAGVIKPGRPVAVAAQDPEAMEIITGICGQSNSALFSYGRDFSSSWKDDGLSYSGIKLHLEGLHPGIPGAYQSGNAALALCASELLDEQGMTVTAEAARKGIEEAFWPGRMETFPGPPRIMLDGAHNPAGARALAEALKRIPRQRLIMIIGVVGDKDVNGILMPLIPLAHRIITVTPAIPRGLPSRELAASCRTLGYAAENAGDVPSGIRTAASMAGCDDLILVCGSLFTVGEARAIILERNFEPFRG